MSTRVTNIDVPIDKIQLIVFSQTIHEWGMSSQNHQLFITLLQQNMGPNNTVRYEENSYNIIDNQGVYRAWIELKKTNYFYRFKIGVIQTSSLNQDALYKQNIDSAIYTLFDRQQIGGKRRKTRKQMRKSKKTKRKSRY
jgi:hypothetical protein